MQKLFYGLLTEEDGQGMTEYGLILGAIAVVAVIAVTMLSGEIETLFDNIATQLQKIGAGV